MTLQEFISNLAVKAGLAQDNQGLSTILTSIEPTVQVDETLSNEVLTEASTATDEKMNNYSEVLNRVLTEQGLTPEVLGEVTSAEKLGEKISLGIQKLTEHLAGKSQETESEFQQKLQELEAQHAVQLEEQTNKTTQDRLQLAIKKIKDSYQYNSSIAPDGIGIYTDALLKEQLAKDNLNTRLNENGTISLITEDGNEFRSETGETVNLSNYYDKIVNKFDLLNKTSGNAPTEAGTVTSVDNPTRMNLMLQQAERARQARRDIQESNQFSSTQPIGSNADVPQVQNAQN